jgi:hypothetical protein
LKGLEKIWKRPAEVEQERVGLGFINLEKFG